MSKPFRHVVCLFFILTIWPLNAISQQLDHDLAIGECSDTISLGQPAKVCRDSAGVLRFLPRDQSQSPQHNDEMTLDKIGSEFSEIDFQNQSAALQVADLLKRVNQLQLALSGRSYDTADLKKDSERLKNQLIEKSEELSARPINSSPSIHQDTEEGPPPEVKDTNASNNSPMQSNIVTREQDSQANNDLNLLDNINRIRYSVTIILLLLLAIPIFKIIAKRAGFFTEAKETSTDGQVIQYLKSRKAFKQYNILAVSSILIGLVISSSLLSATATFALICAFSGSFFVPKITISADRIDPSFSINAAKVAESLNGLVYTKNWKRLRSSEGLLVARGASSDILIIAPNKFWAQQGRVRATGDLRSIRLEKFPTYIWTKRPSNDDEIVRVNWLHPRRTDPNKPDLRYNKNYATYQVRHFNLALQIGAKNWTFTPCNRYVLDSAMLALQRILNRTPEGNPWDDATRTHNSYSEQTEQTKHTEEKNVNVENDIRKWWEVLGVSPNASPDEIKQAKRSAVQKCHPDRVNGLDPDLVNLATKKLTEINAAYDQAKKEGRV